MAKRLLCFPDRRDPLKLKFGQTSFDLLFDFLINLNERNKEHLNRLSKYGRNLKNERITEYILLIAEELGLDPLAGFHAIELFQRFMVRHLADLLATPTLRGATAEQPGSPEDAVFDTLKDKVPLVVLSCVQLASKLSLHCHMVDINAAVRFLQSVGLSVSKRAVLESELMVLKVLDYRLSVPNPLMYVEILLEVLGHNEPTVPVERLYHLCRHVLQFISLQRTDIYDALLTATTQSVDPSREQREKFVTVTEDCMLLGVGVIAVATFILYFRKWDQVVGELSRITGISKRSVSDFAHVTINHIVGATSFKI